MICRENDLRNGVNDVRNWLLVMVFIMSFVLTGCNSENQANQDEHAGHDMHTAMEHDQTGELPKGIKLELDPKFKVGSKVKIIAGNDHMTGMNGATATIVGAYESTAYEVTYMPTDGGPKVNAHKWIIQEEIKDAKLEPYKIGDTVVLNAKHMKGMLGATGTIDSVQPTTVYMVDLTTTDGMNMKNHQWMIENELMAEAK